MNHDIYITSGALLIVCKGAPFVTRVFITSRLNTHFLSTPPHPGQRCLLLVVATCTIGCSTKCSCFHFLLFMGYYLFLLFSTISSMCCYLHYLWLLYVLFVTFYRSHLRQPYICYYWSFCLTWAWGQVFGSRASRIFHFYFICILELGSKFSTFLLFSGVNYCTLSHLF